MSSIRIKELIEKISKGSSNLSKTWVEFTKDLKNYLETGDLEMYRLNNISPVVFNWPEASKQNMAQLDYIRRDESSIFSKAVLTNNYGPRGINLYQNIQLDRVQQVWTLYNLVNFLKLDLSNDEILFEFGGGTGQMADVLAELKFQGTHIVYDLPLLTVLQKYFVTKRWIENQHLLDDEDTKLIKGTNYLPNNQPKSEANVIGMPNINFVATYSLSETDAETHAKFAKYMKLFSRIFIVYWPGKHEICDGVDNTEYIEQIKIDIKDTHNYKQYDNFGNGKVFLAVKNEILSEIVPS
jgi:hypothetical protein